jgi:uncharacterized pyridoxal phosphate-containing UPF0001 family protein
MRPLALASALILSSCRSTNHEGGDLSREQCQELVQHVQALESADTGGLAQALDAARRANVEGCLRRGTERAYRCVLQAESKKDLEPCESLYE